MRNSNIRLDRMAPPLRLCLLLHRLVHILIIIVTCAQDKESSLQVSPSFHLLGEKMLSRIVPNLWEITQRILGTLGDDGVSYIWANFPRTEGK